MSILQVRLILNIIFLSRSTPSPSLHFGLALFIRHYSHKKVQNLFVCTTFRITYTNLDVWFKFQYREREREGATQPSIIHVFLSFLSVCRGKTTLFAQNTYTCTLYAEQNHLLIIFHRNTFFILKAFKIWLLGLNQVSHGSRKIFSFKKKKHLIAKIHPNRTSSTDPLPSLHLSISLCWTHSVRSTTLVFSLLLGIPCLWNRAGWRRRRARVCVCAAQMNMILSAVAARTKDNRIVWVEWKFGIYTVYTHAVVRRVLLRFNFFLFFGLFFSFFIAFTKYMCNMYIRFGSCNKISDIIRK